MLCWLHSLHRSIWLLIAAVLLVFSQAAISKETTYVREYNYDASELESRAVARQNAIRLMKAELLEEVSSFIVSQSELNRTQQNRKFDSSFQSKVRSLSAGSIRSQVLQEKWDGDHFWLKARLFVDKDQVAKDLKQLVAHGAPNPDSRPVVMQAAPTPAAASQPLVMPAAVTPDYSGYVQLAKLSNVLAMMTPIKIRVMQYYQMHGNWPDKLEAIGYDASEMTDGENIKSITLRSSGEIRAHLMPSFGNSKFIALKSRSVMGGSTIKWLCNTNLDAKLMGMPGALPCDAGK